MVNGSRVVQRVLACEAGLFYDLLKNTEYVLPGVYYYSTFPFLFHIYIYIYIYIYNIPHQTFCN